MIETPIVALDAWPRGRRRASGWARACGERGQALVEFAIVLPLLAIVIMAIVKFGITFNSYLQLTDAVRAGARQLAVGRGTSDPCGTAISRVRSAATGLDPAKLTVTATPDVGCSSFASPTSQGEGTTVAVSASYPCDLKIFGIDVAPGCTLNSTTRVRSE